jgi:hypothetical protein
MKTILKLSVIIIITFSGLTSYSQDDSLNRKRASFKIGVFFNSNLNYYGRTDSLRSNGVFFLGELWFNKNIYISAAPVFTNNNAYTMKYAGSVITLGYYKKSESEKFLSHIYLIKPLYETGSQLVQSALKVQGTANFSALNKYVNVNFGGDIKLSDKLDYGLTAGLDHLYKRELSDKLFLFLNPTVTVNAGTQQFTNSYFKKNNFLLFPGVEQQMTEEVNKFNILSYEFSIPVILTKTKFQLILNPAYVIPQNLITVQNSQDLSESGKEMFYITAGVKFIFN